MKKFITLFVILCFSVVCYAEHDYLPFLKQGKKWVTKKYQYLIAGDTVVMGKNYLKVYQRVAAGNDDDGWSYFACAREKNRKVRIIYDKGYTPTTLYDFNCDAQESFQSNYSKGEVQIVLMTDFTEIVINEVFRYSADIVHGYKMSKSDIVAMYKYGYGEQWKEKLVDTWLETGDFEKWS